MFYYTIKHNQTLALSLLKNRKTRPFQINNITTTPVAVACYNNSTLIEALINESDLDINATDPQVRAKKKQKHFIYFILIFYLIIYLINLIFCFVFFFPITQGYSFLHRLCSGPVAATYLDLLYKKRPDLDWK